jgi:hypothetical protein
MNSLIHDELVIVRHTLSVLHNEVERLRMTIMDLGMDTVDYQLLMCHTAVMDAGKIIKQREQELVSKL